MLHLVNSSDIDDKVANEKGRVARMVKDKTPPETIVEELYLSAFSRLPTPEEKTLALDHIARQKEPRRGLEDVAWALLNSREFLFNH